MQTRADAEIVVYSIEGQKPGDQETGKRIVKESKKPKSSKTKTNRGKAEIVVVMQRGFIYYFSIKWLTNNQHRIKINVLTGNRLPGVKIHKEIKHTTRVTGCEEGLNN